MKFECFKEKKKEKFKYLLQDSDNFAKRRAIIVIYSFFASLTN